MDFIFPAVLIFGLAVICAANAIHVLRMTPWEYEQERRRLNPDAALREDLSLGPKCVAFGCWNYTSHRSGLCAQCRGKTLFRRKEAVK